MSALLADPRRRAVALAVLLAGAALAWYLGSPLFLKTYADEALPVPARSAPSTVVTPAAPALGGSDGAATAPTPGAAPVGGVRVLLRGSLNKVDALHHGSGEVRLVESAGKRFVRFENVAISNAPDIHVYLSKDTGGRYAEASALYLGALKATNGSFNYELPAGVELAAYRSVVAWCRNFSTLITWADLAG